VFFVSLAVRDDRQFAVWSTSNQVEEAGRLLLVGLGETLKPRIKLVLGHVVRIVVRVYRLHFRYAFYERLVFVEAGPWTIVNIEVVESLAADVAFIGLKFLLECIVAAPYLTQEQRIEELRRRDDLAECFTIFRRELRSVGR